jgi:hypothetical protein
MFQIQLQKAYMVSYLKPVVTGSNEGFLNLFLIIKRETS